jgi:uncharacterized protein YbgA (DUF1722 family)/uncharacterized protein YbbK (DUF523 family)
MTDETNSESGDAFARIRVGISSCLIGNEVRFDGGHKRDSYVVGTLSEYFDFAPVCPEEAIGLGTPREPIRLVKKSDGVHVVGVKTVTRDVTEALRAYGEKMSRQMTDISGYILKRASPSCGMERVKVYSEEGMPVETGSGKYAEVFMQNQPLLPVEEEGRLGDPVLRENFIVRVFVYHRWQSLLAHGLTAQGLVDFHTDHKYLIMAHDQAAYREMGRMVADTGKRDLGELADEYVAALMTALKKRATRRQHVNVLQHLFGYVSKHVDSNDRAEMTDLIEQYREGLVPLIVPITLLKHHFRRHPDPYIERQYYLTPHPKELMLRNLL